MNFSNFAERLIAYRSVKAAESNDEPAGSDARRFAGGFFYGVALVVAAAFIGWVLVTIVTGALQAAHASTTRWVADERGGERVVVFRDCLQEDDFGRIRLARFGYLTGPDGNRIVLTCVERSS